MCHFFRLLRANHNYELMEMQKHKWMCFGLNVDFQFDFLGVANDANYNAFVWTDTNHRNSSWTTIKKGSISFRILFIYLYQIYIFGFEWIKKIEIFWFFSSQYHFVICSPFTTNFFFGVGIGIQIFYSNSFYIHSSFSINYLQLHILAFNFYI